MTLRTNLISGIVTVVFGAMLVTTFAPALVAAMVCSVFAPGLTNANPAWGAMLSLLLVYGPPWIACGAMFIVAGYCVCMGSSRARRIAQITTVAALPLLVAYAFDCYTKVYPLFHGPQFFPGGIEILKIACAVGGLVLGIALLAGLLFLLSPPKVTEKI